MIFTVLVFAGSLLLLIVAAITYIPLLCYIQGNLKEYVCHKIDKRIAELIKKKQRQRIARAAAIDKKRALAGVAGAGAGTGQRTSMNGGSDLDGYGYGNTPQPTLPQVSLDDEDYQDDIKLRAKIKAESAGMNFPFSIPPPSNGYPPAPPAMGEYGLSLEYGSSTSLVGNAAPLGISYPPSVVTPAPPGGPRPIPGLPQSNSMSSLPSLPSYSSVNINAENRQQLPPLLPHSNSIQSINQYIPGATSSGRVSPYDRHDQYEYSHASGQYDSYDLYDSYTQDYVSHPQIVQPPLPPASQPQTQPQPQPQTQAHMLPGYQGYTPARAAHMPGYGRDPYPYARYE